MGYERTADGRINVGMGVTSADNYNGYADVRDIVIQLTEDGATQDGLNALEYIKAYALAHKAEDKPIFPVSQNIYVSNNGKTKALEYDDIVIDGTSVTIGGIVWDGSAWDFTNAESGGGSGGGSSGGGVLVATDTNGVLDKKYSEILASTMPVVIHEAGLWKFVTESYESNGAYLIGAIGSEDGELFANYYVADSADGYPELQGLPDDIPADVS